MKGVAVADSDWDEDDWESGWAERRFDLGKEDGGGNLIKDDCDKYDDDDDDCDDCGDNTSCNVSIINFENFMFPFSIKWRWSLSYSSMFREFSGKVQSGLTHESQFFLFFAIVSQIIIGLINFYSSRRPMNVSW